MSARDPTRRLQWCRICGARYSSTDGEIFWVIKNGIPPDLLMEPWSNRLSDTDVWSVVNFIRDLAKQ